MKKIKNIVFYETYVNGKVEKRACFFLMNGYVEDVSYGEAINACFKICKERNITSKKEFANMINKDTIHVVSEKKLLNNLNYYSPTIDEIKEAQKLEKEARNKRDKNKNFDLPKKSNKISDTNTLNCNVVNTEKKPGIFKNAFNKFKKSRVAKRVVAVATAFAVAIGAGHFALNHKSMKGKMLDSNVITTSQDIGGDPVQQVNASSNVNIVIDNSNYDNYSYEQLQSVTSNVTQKESMNSLYNTITSFNGDFASSHIEQGKDIRAALKYDEVIALQTAYNDYSKDELKAIFNGADIKSRDLVNAYKDATLQLMGAYIIETPECPVNMSYLLESDEAKNYYNKMHQMFMNANNATGQDKIDKVNAFYNQIRNDFPISEEERTEGISHSDSRNSLESYKLSVVPMVAAGEIMWQNLDVDMTLDDTSIDWLNDIGLCNYAEETFDRIETITLTSDEDIYNPTYDQYKTAIEKYLAEKGMAVIDDEHRELSKLDAFQNKVNYNFESSMSSFTYSSGTAYSTSSYQTSTSHTETSTTYRTEETRESVSADQVPQAEREKLENQINSEIAKENEQAKAEAEEKAEETRKQIQASEDENARKVNEEVKEDEKKLQEDISNANEKIDKNNSDDNKSTDTPVNEKDFDGNVDFDNNHSDNAGNLDDSVKDITTDGTGADKELPDPNKTGAEFDKQAETSQAQVTDTATSTNTSSTTEQTHESYEVVEDNSTYNSNNEIYEYDEVIEEEIQPTQNNNTQTTTYEEAVDNYIESQANQTPEEESYQYTK